MSNSKVCPLCGNPDPGTICIGCGTVIDDEPEAKLCIRCNKEIASYKEMCATCEKKEVVVPSLLPPSSLEIESKPSSKILIPVVILVGILSVSLLLILLTNIPSDNVSASTPMAVAINTDNPSPVTNTPEFLPSPQKISGKTKVPVPTATPQVNIKEDIKLAEYYFDAKEYEKAKKILDEAIRKEAKNVDALILLGDIYTKQDKLAESSEQYKKVLEIEFDNELAHFGMGRIYQKQGKKDQAIEEYKKAPNYSSAHANSGIIYEENGRRYEAIEEFEKAVKLDPTDGNTYINLAGLYYRMENWQEAINFYNIAIEKKPENPLCYYGLGLSYINIGKPGKAVSYLKKFIELAPDDPKVEEAQKILNQI